MKLGIKDIMRRLPHRYPFLLVDRVVDGDGRSYIETQKNITFNEPCFMGHFPGIPVFPGVLIVEAMAQSTGILAFEIVGGQIDDDTVFMLVGVDRARFKRQVVPGDVLRMRAEVTKRSRNMMKFDVVARVDDAVACTVEIFGAFAKNA
ncbi:MAG: 3-hydroxyacyl-[acyl-carrier-protein] dehydratase FabZ [Gammaproteobacteria bacterium]|nr:MAG: 3-hydroxyacyl-[acyl-carrier-protein] dehydratase FabZ [Gammaproteobacteria bacterium]